MRLRETLGKLADGPYLLMAALAAGAARAGDARAAGIGDLAEGVQTQFQGLGNLLIAGSFLTGMGLGAAGLMRLKAAADSGGQQVKYGEGLWRLGVGAGLIGLPAVAGVGVDTLFGEGGANEAPEMGTAVFTSGGGTTRL